MTGWVSRSYFCSPFQLKATIKNWEDKHKELNEKIKVYQKSQKELEDSVVLKDHNVEVGLIMLSVKLDVKVWVNNGSKPSPFRFCPSFWQI